MESRLDYKIQAALEGTTKTHSKKFSNHQHCPKIEEAIWEEMKL